MPSACRGVWHAAVRAAETECPLPTDGSGTTTGFTGPEGNCNQHLPSGG